MGCVFACDAAQGFYTVDGFFPDCGYPAVHASGGLYSLHHGVASCFRVETP